MEMFSCKKVIAIKRYVSGMPVRFFDFASLCDLWTMSAESSDSSATKHSGYC